MSQTETIPEGFDFNTAVSNERDPCESEIQIAKKLQECVETDTVGWSGTAESITVTGESVLLLAVHVCHETGCVPTIGLHELNDDGGRVRFSVEESLEHMAHD